MQSVLDELAGIQGVTGTFWFDTRGVMRHRTFAIEGSAADPVDSEWWQPFLAALNGVKEIELAYAGGRVYMRRNAEGYLMVRMTSSAPIALVRLNCDILLNKTATAGSKGKRKRFFNRRF